MGIATPRVEIGAQKHGRDTAAPVRGSVIVVDMVEDTLSAEPSYPITPRARAIVPRVNEVIRLGRRNEWPVVFACDSFMPGDFIFRGKLKPHSLRGTPGEQVYRELLREPADLVLPKRRFSAFFKTDLDQTLRTWAVDTVVICGITTHVCVLTTALDAVSHDFSAVIVEDATTSHSAEAHAAALQLYRRTPLYPLLRVLKYQQLVDLSAGPRVSPP